MSLRMPSHEERVERQRRAAGSVAAPRTLTLPDHLYLLGVRSAVVTDEAYLAKLGTPWLAAVVVTGAAADGVLDWFA